MKIVIITSIVVLLWCVIYKTCHSRKDTPLASGSDFLILALTLIFHL